MRTLKYFGILVSLIILGFGFINAQDLKKLSNEKLGYAEFQVAGVCGMCKERIENLASISGVRVAKWNAEAQKLELLYKYKSKSFKVENVDQLSLPVDMMSMEKKGMLKPIRICRAVANSETE